MGMTGVYYGESSRPAYVRGKEHKEDQRLRRDKSVLCRHSHEAHNGTPIEWKMEVTGTFSSSLERQIEESIRINQNEDQADFVMNAKHEWNAAISTQWGAQQPRARHKSTAPPPIPRPAPAAPAPKNQTQVMVHSQTQTQA